MKPIAVFIVFILVTLGLSMAVYLHWYAPSESLKTRLDRNVQFGLDTTDSFTRAFESVGSTLDCHQQEIDVLNGKIEALRKQIEELKTVRTDNEGIP